MRFLCDEMLLRFGRWLRAAGHDTAIAAAGEEDRALIERALAEERMLLTRDRALAERAASRVPVLLLAGEGLDQAARHLRLVLGLDWLSAPFTRCLVDNAPLVPETPEAIAQVPSRSREAAAAGLKRCPDCRRLYWPGGHFQRMQTRLARWQGEAAATAE